MKKLILTLTLLVSSWNPAQAGGFACEENNIARDGGATFTLFETENKITKATLVMVSNQMGRLSVKKKIIENLNCTFDVGTLESYPPQSVYSLSCKRDDLATDGARHQITLKRTEDDASYIESTEESVPGFSGKLVKKTTIYGSKTTGLKCDFLFGKEVDAFKAKIRSFESPHAWQQTSAAESEETIQNSAL